MNTERINRILNDTAYVHMGGTEEELRCAEYLKKCCADMGLEAHLEDFSVPMAEIQTAKLYMDGVEVTCKGYFCSGTAEVEAPFIYLPDTDPCSLTKCKGKIVMVDGRMGYWLYQDLMEQGMVGFITYDSRLYNTDNDIDQRELRAAVHKGNRVPGVNINVKDAVELIRKGVSTVKIVLEQNEYEGTSRDVVMDLPGEVEETIVLTAHYDTTSLSLGSYDNMSGSIGLLGIAEYFKDHPHRRSLRFVWCGSEERGLLGSKAYVAAHEEELGKVVLNINLDMIGSIMGKFIACCTAEEKLCHYIEYMAAELGRGITVRQDVYSSDSTPFADKGVPAMSFARLAPGSTGEIHTRYDTPEIMKAEHVQEDIEFIVAFADRMANAAFCPVKREIPENMKEKLDIYLFRKRDKK